MGTYVALCVEHYLMWLKIDTQDDLVLNNSHRGYVANRYKVKIKGLKVLRVAKTRFCLIPLLL